MHKQAADLTGHISRFCLTKYELRQSSAVRRTVSLCAVQLSGMFSILSCLTRFTNCIGYADLHEGIFNREGNGENWLRLFSGCSSLESVVGIATAYGLDGRGIGDRVPVEARFFLSPRHPDRFLAPPSLLLSPGIMRQVCEANHAPQTSAEVKNTWIYTSAPPYVFMVYYIKFLDRVWIIYSPDLCNITLSAVDYRV
jgi:hypothetical protein